MEPSSTTSPASDSTTNGEAELLTLELCCFCSVPLTQQKHPKALPCLHVACESCCSSQRKTCPICGEDYLNIDQPFLLAETAPVMFCTPCKDNDEKSLPATFMCDTCKEYLCDEDRRMHTRPKKMKGHQIRPLTTEQQPNCGTHLEPLDYFCDTCNMALCAGCHSAHPNHIFGSIKEKIKSLQAQCATEASQLENQKRHLSEQNDKASSMLEESKNNSLNSIHEAFRRLEALFQRKKQDIIAKVENDCMDQQARLTDVQNDVRLICKKFEQCHKMASRMSQFGVGSGSAEMLGNLMSHYRPLKQRCNALNMKLSQMDRRALVGPPAGYMMQERHMDGLAQQMEALTVYKQIHQPPNVTQQQPAPDVQVIEPPRAVLAVQPQRHPQPTAYLAANSPVPQVGPQTQSMVKVLRGLIDKMAGDNKKIVTGMVQELLFGIRAPDDFMRAYYSMSGRDSASNSAPNFVPILTTELPAIRLLLAACHERIEGIMPPTDHNKAIFMSLRQQSVPRQILPRAMGQRTAHPQQQQIMDVPVPVSSPIQRSFPQYAPTQQQVQVAPVPNNSPPLSHSSPVRSGSTNTLQMSQNGSMGPGSVKRPRLAQSADVSDSNRSYELNTPPMPAAASGGATAASSMPPSSAIISSMKSLLPSPLNWTNCAVCGSSRKAGLKECDTCERVFHRKCHAPVLSETVDELDDFNCRLCSDDIPLDAIKNTLLRNNSTEMSDAEIKMCERIFLHLLCESGFFEQFGEIDQSMTELQPKMVLQRFTQGKYIKWAQFIEELKMSLGPKPQWSEQKSKVAHQAMEKLKRLLQIALPEENQ